MFSVTKKSVTIPMFATAAMWASFGAACASAAGGQYEVAVGYAAVAACAWPFRMKFNVTKINTEKELMEKISEVTGKKTGIIDLDYGDIGATNVPGDAPDWVRNANSAFMAALNKEIDEAWKRAAKPFVDEGLMEVEKLPRGYAIGFRNPGKAKPSKDAA